MKKLILTFLFIISIIGYATTPYDTKADSVGERRNKVIQGPQGGPKDTKVLEAELNVIDVKSKIRTIVFSETEMLGQTKYIENISEPKEITMPALTISVKDTVWQPVSITMDKIIILKDIEDEDRQIAASLVATNAYDRTDKFIISPRLIDGREGSVISIIESTVDINPLEEKHGSFYGIARVLIRTN